MNKPGFKLPKYWKVTKHENSFTKCSHVWHLRDGYSYTQEVRSFLIFYLNLKIQLFSLLCTTQKKHTRQQPFPKTTPTSLWSHTNAPPFPPGQCSHDASARLARVAAQPGETFDTRTATGADRRYSACQQQWASSRALRPRCQSGCIHNFIIHTMFFRLLSFTGSAIRKPWNYTA